MTTEVVYSGLFGFDRFEGRMKLRSVVCSLVAVV